MARFALAMDLGTSGLRGQAIDISSGEIISTVITTRHPLPGANVMDHLHFALELGAPAASGIMIEAVNRVIARLRVPMEDVARFALCGNPVQLSLFQGMEIRDLAYAGTRKLAALRVVPPKREGAIIPASEIPGLNLPAHCEVVIPPAVRHEVGADALAMIIRTGMLERDETSLATDFGTNAEVALFHEGRVITGSTAAGPAIEGQRITCGMLAAPGAVCDLEPEHSHHRLVLLDADMLPVRGALIDLADKGFIADVEKPRPVGITGTGAVAVIIEGIESGLIALPHIRTADNRLHLGEDIFLTEGDLAEAGKAFGAVRGGHMTLCREAGISPEEIRTAYMAGASGTYVDALKAQRLGLVPPRVKTVCQVGNTSLAMAVELATNPEALDTMVRLAGRLRESHCNFSESKAFQRIYILELAYWTEGMPMSEYRRFLKKFGMPDLAPAGGTPEVIRSVLREISDLGPMGIETITDIGRVTTMIVEGCISCRRCIEECPEGALSMAAAEPGTVTLDEALCDGLACGRCERACPEKVFNLNRFFNR
jgi:methylamine methyltransferase corrinoid activation protein